MACNTPQKYLEAVCAYVDDPNSKGASVFNTTYVLFRSANRAVVEAKNACSSSETCSAAQTAAEGLSSSVSSILSSVSNSLGQTIGSIPNKTKMWLLENKIDIIRNQLDDIKKNSYTGLVVEHVRGYPWSHWLLNSLSGGTLEEILTLEKQMKDIEARLFELKQS